MIYERIRRSASGGNTQIFLQFYCERMDSLGILKLLILTHGNKLNPCSISNHRKKPLNMSQFESTLYCNNLSVKQSNWVCR